MVDSQIQSRCAVHAGYKSAFFVFDATSGMHPSLRAFAVGFVVPHFDPDNYSVAERTEEETHPYGMTFF